MEAGYLGVGNMGQPMAHKLLDGGHSLTVYDVNEAAMQPLLERQARRATSPKDLADQCEMVFVSLPTLAAFREVAFGAAGPAKGKALKLLVNACTVGVPFVKEIGPLSEVGPGRRPRCRKSPHCSPGHRAGHSSPKSSRSGRPIRARW
jgi:3-hydroxyisobutyrate dehydrogenase-like beta-hydroxyacid dehydrogenase